ncbi:MAG: imidazolonepropionase [Candidatus Thermoplasmatota archaeon]
MAERCDLLVKNGHVIALAGGLRRGRAMNDLGAIAKGAIAISGSTIVWVGKSSESSIFRAEEVVDAEGRLVVPGFVDPHTHLIFAGSREHELTMKLEGMSYLEIMKAGGGIHSTTRRTRDATLENLVEQSVARAERMIAMGTTTLEAKSGYCLETEGEIKMLRAAVEVGKRTGLDVVPTFLGAHAVPPEFADAEQYTEHIIKEMIPRVAREGIARFCDVFCEEGVFDIQQSERILRAAEAHGMGLKLHADEFAPLGGGRLAARLGAISADHLLATPKEDYPVMARAGVIGVLLPAVPYVTMSERVPDAMGMIDAGMPIALATDLNPNCWLESMQMVISLACYRMRMTPSEALCGATINAAHAIGMGDRVGSIEPGKQADLLMLDVHNVDSIPYRWGGNLVKRVWKRGKEMVWRE